MATASPGQTVPSSYPSASPFWPAGRSGPPAYPRQPFGPSRDLCSSHPHLGGGGGVRILTQVNTHMHTHIHTHTRAHAHTCVHTQ